MQIAVVSLISSILVLKSDGSTPISGVHWKHYNQKRTWREARHMKSRLDAHLYVSAVQTQSRVECANQPCKGWTPWTRFVGLQLAIKVDIHGVAVQVEQDSNVALFDGFAFVFYLDSVVGVVSPHADILEYLKRVRLGIITYRACAIG